MNTKIIFDLEATCEDKEIQAYFDNEIIEIGAVKLVDGEVVDEFQTFVKPVRTSELTDFCKNLTKIKQEDVDNAKGFPEALSDFLNWAGQGAEFLSWGFYDKKQLKKDCEYHKLGTAFLSKHRSVKHEHQQIKNLKRAVGVQKALKLEGLSFEGTHHRGIDDARNIAKVYLSVFKEENK